MCVIMYPDTTNIKSARCTHPILFEVITNVVSRQVVLGTRVIVQLIGYRSKKTVSVPLHVSDCVPIVKQFSSKLFVVGIVDWLPALRLLFAGFSITSVALGSFSLLLLLLLLHSGRLFAFLSLLSFAFPHYRRGSMARRCP